MRHIHRAVLPPVWLLLGCASADLPIAGDEGVASLQSGLHDGTGATECDSRYFFFVDEFFHPERPRAVRCCQDHNQALDRDEAWHLNQRGTLVHRLVGGGLCTEEDGVSTGCSGPDCFYGPCGASRPVLLGQGPSYLFHPVSQPGACGWQVTVGGLSLHDPEPYADQEQYPGVTGTCLFTACLAGGVPSVTLTLTAIADGATGHVKSIPKGLAISGAGEAAWAFTQTDIKLSADPRGRRARAVFSLDDCQPTIEDCAAAGRYGKEVGFRLTLRGDRSVSVTFECEPGFACDLDL